jgi:hypothetical protein
VVIRPWEGLWGCSAGVDAAWEVINHRVLVGKPGNTFPSDHFGVMADLAWRGEPR